MRRSTVVKLYDVKLSFTVNAAQPHWTKNDPERAYDLYLEMEDDLVDKAVEVYDRNANFGDDLDVDLCIVDTTERRGHALSVMYVECQELVDVQATVRATTVRL